jgi:exonuclease SbcD
MKLVHIADTHLGLAQFNRIDPENGMNLREELIYSNFLQSVDRILAERPDVSVHAGDLFDQVRPKTMAYTTALEALDRIADAGIPVVMVAGNHSMPKTRYTPSPFRVLEYHRAEFHAAYRYRYERVEIGDSVFHLIPNMLRPGDYRTAYDQVTCDQGRYNILVTHGLASTLRDHRLNTVAEHEIDSTLLSGGFDYIALGHYHGQVQAGSRAWYSGSAEYLSYGEIRDTKGGLLVDPGRGRVDPLPLVNTPMIDLGTVYCQEEPSRAVPGLIKTAIGKGKPELISLAQVTVVCQSREQAKAIDHQALARERERLLDLKIKTVIREEDQPVPDETDLHAIDYLAEFDVFLKKKNLVHREASFVRDQGRAALLAALRRDEDAS